MIIDTIINSIPSVSSDKIAGKLYASSFKKPSAIITNDVCPVCCAYVEPVFSESGSIVTAAKNDKTSMLFKKLITSDTIKIEIFKKGIDIVIANVSDGTYGTYYSTFSAQSKYVGFIADWNKIYNHAPVVVSGSYTENFKSGIYYFKITQTILAESTTTDSIYYKLLEYKDERANGTVRIETYNTGTILNSDFDYNGLLTGGWYQSFRIRGKLMPKQPKTETDRYLDENYNQLQIQDKINNEWILITAPLPSIISNKLIYDNMLANTIIVSDFNAFNEEYIREKYLLYEEVTEKTGHINHIFKIRLSEKTLNNIKNNF